ncbi:ABC transporter permease subunit [Roseateles violae]|uniref:ABC transporter permease subunit n=1 Tax=Roseateles violae TaxID=3058042 RepID=A0ABT8DM20_9BURK|nr:ABC transporter permease subunit [Pelomonas sp. PFR6]MDN3919452.1 ABC transporter permease subunit [Pelomonas sp. PFR6]
MSSAVAETSPVVPDHPSPLREFWSGFSANRGALIALIVFALIALAAILSPLIAPHSPIEQFREHMLQPPVWAEGGSWRFILGTDELGRDILSRLLHGGRVSLGIGLASVFLSLLPGVLLGLLAAFYQHSFSPVIMRVMDIMLALPALLLAICVITVLGPGLINTVIAIAIGALPGYTRLTRAAALAEIGRDYVTASRVAGAGVWRLMFITVLPNCMAPLIVNATLSFSSAILETAGLGFLGLGVQAPTPEWGTMLSAARDYIERAPWVVTLPGLTILVSVLAINLMGDGLRDALDPKLKRVS